MLYIILNLVELFDEAFDMEVAELGHEFGMEQWANIGEDFEEFDAQANKKAIINKATNVTFSVHYYAASAPEGKFPFFLMISDRGGRWM